MRDTFGHNMRMQDSTFSDTNVRTDNTKRADDDIFANLCTLFDNRRRMNLRAWMNHCKLLFYLRAHISFASQAISPFTVAIPVKAVIPRRSLITSTYSVI